ncbi:hypothetical protein FACS189468_2030 [Spirochaetia bacterium]|nr:hypothetical protein FACS189468_2030 [Spirochaetia bacterium]
MAGIIKDSTFFGYYKSYISRAALNSLIGYEPEVCSIIGFYLRNQSEVEPKRALLYKELSQHISTSRLSHNRDEFDEAKDEDWEGLRIFLLTIPVYLSEISELLDAMNILTYFLYGMMLLIILVSAAVTYRLILHERTREIGTMRAIGFYEGDVRYILVTETICLGFVSLIAGFIFARLLSWGLSFLSFSWFPSFEIFMRNGKLTALYIPGTVLINALAVFCMLFLAVWFPVFRSSRKPLPQMLSGGAL